MRDNLRDQKESVERGVPEGTVGPNGKPPQWAYDAQTAYRIVQKTWKQARDFRVARNDERSRRKFAESEVARLKAELQAVRSRKGKG
jgi:hypothetical protein